MATKVILLKKEEEHAEVNETKAKIHAALIISQPVKVNKQPGACGPVPTAKA
jgi:hypothetical protein